VALALSDRRSVSGAHYARGVRATGTVWDAFDAWLFGSIGSQGGRLPLAELLRAADRGKPEALAEGRLEGSLAKLVGSGLVCVYEDWALELTDEGASLLEDCGRGYDEYLQTVAERLTLIDPTPIKLRVPRKVLENVGEASC
jgi:hypothetical protein